MFEDRHSATGPTEDADLARRLRERAVGHGFTLFGIAPATEADGFDRFAGWLDAGYAGEMDYLHDHREQRRHPANILQSVRCVVMLGFDYGDASGSEFSVSNTDRSSPRTSVAKYATGPDYHRFLWDKLNDLAAWLEAERPGCRAKGAADSAPLLERDFARRAGLGWFGKNTMLIDKHRGSFFFLAALLTSLDLPLSDPHTASHCGTCTACLDACPTQAFPEPGVLDARKCISYLTIELRGAIPLELREPMGGWLFGCDICQDVCPWNRHGAAGSFPANPELVALDPVELLSLDDAGFRRRFRGTSFYRAKRTGLLRNAAIVLGNTGDANAIPTLELAALDGDEVIREAAAWALEKLRRRMATSVQATPKVSSESGTD